MLQERRVFLNQVGSVAMADDEVEVALLEEVILDPGKYQGGVTFADLGNDHANGEASFLAQRSGHQIRTVVQLASGGTHTFLGAGGDGFGTGRAVDDQRDRRGRQSKMGGEFLQADGRGGQWCAGDGGFLFGPYHADLES